MCSDCKTGFNMFLLLFNCCLCLALTFLPDWSSFMKVCQILWKTGISKSNFFFLLQMLKKKWLDENIVKATFNSLLIKVKFPISLKASHYLNINSVLKMHNNMHLQLIVIVFYNSGKKLMASTYYYVLRT